MFLTISDNVIVNLKEVCVIKQRMSNAQKIVEVIVDGKPYIVNEKYLKDLILGIESFKPNKLEKQFFAG